MGVLQNLSNILPPSLQKTRAQVGKWGNGPLAIFLFFKNLHAEFALIL